MEILKTNITYVRFIQENKVNNIKINKQKVILKVINKVKKVLKKIS